MHKTKLKSGKSDKLPKPIKIKKEKTEEDRSLHDMSHYIDDRLELVKQIFGTLKPKTIINLAPEFLKKKKMDDIEEMCLNELLCISTKRLTSIINATKCPTDTESSGDSDVEHQEEHISLEEISSDSEIEGTSTSAGKKKSNGAAGRPGIKKNTKNATEKNENGGQISVLELLELQARARAIRSQLALEPITKIEVDSDDQKNGNVAKSSASSKEDKHSQAERKGQSSEKIKEASKSRTSSMSTTSSKVNNSNGNTSQATTTSNTTASKEGEKPEKPPTKRIKLKRNYRSSNRNTEKNDDNTQAGRIITTESANVSKNLKKERRSRSHSPDVITIVPEPETLLISDSSDGEKENTTKKSATKITVEKPVECSQKAASDNTESATEKQKRERKLTEPEEGEISEHEETCTDNEQMDAETTEIEKSKAVDKTIDGNNDTANAAVQQNLVTTETTEATTVLETATAENADKKGETASRKSAAPAETNSTAGAKTSIIPATDSQSESTPKLNEDANAAVSLDDDDDQNDDIISIEGGDLESEMIEHLEEDTNTKSSFASSPKKTDLRPQEQDADIISLESSEDERDKKSSESWHSRYLKSSKVSKVLAASRLGKRVRDKIKKSKRSKNESEREAIAKEKEKPSKVAFASKHEDGSVEQYKELLEMHQRKT